MKFYTVAFIIALGSTLSMSALAAASIRDVQVCQGVLLFLDGRLDKAEDVYSSSDIKVVRKGLDQYYTFISNELMPALIQKNARGDKAQASSIQQKIDEANANIVGQYKLRYQDNLLYTEYAMTLNECAKKGIISANTAEQESLKASLLKIIALAKTN